MSWQAWRHYFGYYRGFRLRLGLVSAVALFQATLLVPVALIVRNAFDRMIPAKDFHGLVLAGAGILGLYAFSHTLVLFTRYQTLKISKAAIQRFRDDLLRKVYALSRNYHTRADRQKLHTHIVQDTERLDVMTNAAITFLFPSALMSLALAAVLAYLNAWLFLLLLLVLPVLFLAGRFIGRKFRRHVKRFHEKFEGFSKGMHFILRMIDLTRTVSAEDREIERQSRVHEELRETSGRMAWIGTAYTATQNMLVVCGGLLILVVGGRSVIEQRISLGDLLAFYFGFGLLREHLRTVYNSVPDIVAGTESLGHLYRILHLEDELPYRGSRRVALQGNIRFDDVSFGYGAEPILKNVGLQILPGRTYALVGANGSGKSTLLNLVLGFYRPQSGRVFAEGLPYDDLDMAALRAQIGVVLQDPMLFPGTLRENIAYGMPEAGDAAVQAAAALANADGFIRALSQGYDSPLGENGVLLSGGQGQRIALARALLRRPSLLILDEPTNHLDALAVRALRDNLTAHFRHIAILVVSHDERMVEMSDEVFLMEEGRIVATGDPAGLRGTPAYARLFGAASPLERREEHVRGA